MALLGRTWRSRPYKNVGWAWNTLLPTKPGSNWSKNVQTPENIFPG